jgi:hypothetical protein
MGRAHHGPPPSRAAQQPGPFASSLMRLDCHPGWPNRLPPSPGCCSTSRLPTTELPFPGACAPILSHLLQSKAPCTISTFAMRTHLAFKLTTTFLPMCGPPPRRFATHHRPTFLRFPLLGCLRYHPAFSSSGCHQALAFNWPTLPRKKSPQSMTPPPHIPPSLTRGPHMSSLYHLRLDFAPPRPCLLTLLLYPHELGAINAPFPARHTQTPIDIRCHHGETDPHSLLPINLG